MNKKNDDKSFTLTPEQKAQMLEEIKYYFSTERDMDLGIIASESILEFFMDNLGNSIYNKALDDSKVWYSRRMEDVEADFYTLYKNIR